MKDEIIAELWRSKDTISAKYSHDARKLAEHLRAKENSSDSQIIDLHARNRTASRATQIAHTR